MPSLNNDTHAGRRNLWTKPALITALLLLITLLGNSFVDGWNWGLPGFLLLGALVFGAGLTYELVTRNVKSVAYRVAFGVALAATFILVWMNRVQAADDVNPYALMFLGVPVVGIIGVCLARLQPAGMARALFATALAQALLLAMTLILWYAQSPPSASAVARAIGLNGFFLLLFIGSALLFRRAARGELTGNAV